MKRLASLFLLAAASLLAKAQTPTQPLQQGAITAINSTPTAACSTGSCVTFKMEGQGAAQIQLGATGWTASGGLSAQVTTDGNYWVTLSKATTFTRLACSSSCTSATIPSGATNEIYQLSAECTAAFACRITALGAVTGSADVKARTSPVSLGGGGSAGTVTGGQDAVGQASTTAGQSGVLSQCAASSSAPSYTAGTTNPLSCDLAGNLRTSGGGGGGGGTSSTVGAAVPSTGTAAGMSDGTNMQLPRVYDTDSGGGTQYTMGVNLRIAGSGGSVEGGTSANPIRVDPTGTTTQPVSAASLPLPAGAATSANQTTGNSSLSSIDTKTPALVSGRVPVDPSGVTSPISAASLPLPTGAATAANQSTGNTSLSNIDGDMGAAADSACGSDNGSCSLIALVKRNNQNQTTQTAAINSDPNYTTTDGGASAARGIKILGKGGANDVAPSVTTNTVPVNMSTATTTQHVALSGSTLIRITAMLLIAGGTTNVTLQYGTGTNCGTGTTALTGPLPLIANAGFSLGNGFGAALVVPSGQALCITNSAGVQVSGFISYEQH